MEYCLVLLLVAAASGLSVPVKPISGYQYIHHPLHQVVSHVPAVTPVVASVKSSILTDEDKLSTTLVENAPLKPVVQVVGSPLVKFVPAVVEAKEAKVAEKAVEAKVEVAAYHAAPVHSIAYPHVYSAPANFYSHPAAFPFSAPVVKSVAAPVPVVSHVAPVVSHVAPVVSHVAPAAPGYVAVNAGAIHKAPLPVGPSGEGLLSSFHHNLPADISTKLSRRARSAEELAVVKPAAVYAHHVPAYPHLAYPHAAYPAAPVHSISYPHVYSAPANFYSSVQAAFPYSAPVVVKSVAAPVPVVSQVAQVVSQVAPVVSQVAPVVSHVAPAVKVEVAQAAPGYVAVNAGAVHKAPLPVGPSGDGFYASHHVNL